MEQRMSGFMGPGRVVAVSAAAALFVGFFAGFCTGRAADAPAQAATWPGVAGVLNWPGFGKPRAANARRAAEVKPDGFAIWKTHIYASRADPLYCVTMTR